MRIYSSLCINFTNDVQLAKPSIAPTVFIWCIVQVTNTVFWFLIKIDSWTWYALYLPTTRSILWRLNSLSNCIRRKWNFPWKFAIAPRAPVTRCLRLCLRKQTSLYKFGMLVSTYVTFVGMLFPVQISLNYLPNHKVQYSRCLGWWNACSLLIDSLHCNSLWNLQVYSYAWSVNNLQN